jgi:hypothetical protein
VKQIQTGAVHKFQAFAIALAVISSFAPYLGIPVGNNTSFPLSSLFALMLLPSMLERGHTVSRYVLLTFALVSIEAVTVDFRYGSFDFKAPIFFCVLVMTGIAFLELSRNEVTLILKVLRVANPLEVAFALIQKYLFLDHSQLPFSSYYNLAGFASVNDNLAVILNYVRRPFGLYPETSFMVAALAMTFACQFLIARKLDRLRPGDLVSYAGLVWLFSISGSGASYVSILLLSLYLASGIRRTKLRNLVYVFASLTPIPAFVIVTQLRNSANNWSWDDRLTSIIATFLYTFRDPFKLFFGGGLGSVSQAFSSGKIPTFGLEYSHDIPDIYSVLGRVICELGLCFGLPFLLVMVRFIFTAGREKLREGLFLFALWVLAAGLTTSYASCVWIWIMPALIRSTQLVNIEADIQDV